jgi:hypothetical protein
MSLMLRSSVPVAVHGRKAQKRERHTKRQKSSCSDVAMRCRNRPGRSQGHAESRNANFIDTPQRGKVLVQNIATLAWALAAEARAGDHEDLAGALHSQDARLYLSVSGIWICISSSSSSFRAARRRATRGGGPQAEALRTSRRVGSQRQRHRRPRGELPPMPNQAMEHG